MRLYMGTLEDKNLKDDKVVLSREPIKLANVKARRKMLSSCEQFKEMFGFTPQKGEIYMISLKVGETETILKEDK